MIKFLTRRTIKLMLISKSLNYKVLFIFAPILILTGAAAYNIFHLTFGAVGIFLLLLKKEKLICLFNIGNGLLDL